jgi:hypothetical protein
MGLSNPTQELKRYLSGLAADFKSSGVELLRIAERLTLAGNEADAQAVLKMCTVSILARTSWQGMRMG